MIITPSFARLSHQCLQFINQGSTLVHLEEESGRTCMCFLRLEADNSTLTWKKPNWSALRGNISSLPDYVLRGDFEYSSIQAMYTRYCSGENVIDCMEEGYLDLTILKGVCWAHEDDIDLSTTCKRYGLQDITPDKNCLCLTYGNSVADNKHLRFVGPTHVIKTWYQGLKTICQAVTKLHKQTDKRIQWLKMQYLQLYYDSEKCQGPTPAEAIRVSNSSYLSFMLHVFLLWTVLHKYHASVKQLSNLWIAMAVQEAQVVCIRVFNSLLIAVFALRCWPTTDIVCM